MIRRILREGFVAGLIGAGAVAVWFFGVDILAGRPFFTPAMLGSAIFWGVRDPTAVHVAFSVVIGYTMVHVLGFWIVGVAAAALSGLVDRFPTTLFLALMFFVVFEVGFYIAVAVIAQPLLGALAWFNVAAGNLIAAIGMGFYLWNVHPQIREKLARQPLGATGEN
jgi:hypothetical protein